MDTAFDQLEDLDCCTLWCTRVPKFLFALFTCNFRELQEEFSQTSGYLRDEQTDLEAALLEPASPGNLMLRYRYCRTEMPCFKRFATYKKKQLSDKSTKKNARVWGEEAQNGLPVGAGARGFDTSLDEKTQRYRAHDTCSEPYDPYAIEGHRMQLHKDATQRHEAAWTITKKVKAAYARACYDRKYTDNVVPVGKESEVCPFTEESNFWFSGGEAKQKCKQDLRCNFKVGFGS